MSDAEEGLGTTIDLKLAGSRGNVDLIEIGAGVAIRWHKLFEPSVQPAGAPPFFRRRFVLVANRDFGSVGGSRFADRGFAHVL